jgi:hypothetical protein
MRTSDTAKCSSLKRWLRNSSVVALVAAVFMIIGTLPASASCGFAANVKPGNAPKPMALPAQEGEPASAPEHNSIVGFWHVVLTLSPADGGGMLYQSLQQFHADGLEMESADLDPSGGNACMGVWKKTGPRTVEIYHVGWIFAVNPLGAGYFVLTEKNKLGEDGNTWTGTFEIKTFGPDGTPTHDLTGTIAATRLDFSHHFSPPSTP